MLARLYQLISDMTLTRCVSKTGGEGSSTEIELTHFIHTKRWVCF